MITEKIDWLMIHSVDPFSWLGIESIRLPHYRGWWAGIYVLYFVVLSLLVFALARWKPLRLQRTHNAQDNSCAAKCGLCDRRVSADCFDHSDASV